MTIHNPTITGELPHHALVIPVTEEGWLNAGYRWLSTCWCGHRKETISREAADLAAYDHNRNTQ